MYEFSNPVHKASRIYLSAISPSLFLLKPPLSIGKTFATVYVQTFLSTCTIASLVESYSVDKIWKITGILTAALSLSATVKVAHFWEKLNNFLLLSVHLAPLCSLLTLESITYSSVKFVRGIHSWALQKQLARWRTEASRSQGQLRTYPQSLPASGCLLGKWEHLTQLAAQIKTGQIRTQAALGCSPGEREATGGLRAVGGRGRSHYDRMRQTSLQETRLRQFSLQNNFPSSTVSYGNKVYIIMLFTGKLLDPLANFKCIWENSRCFEDRV